MSYTLHPPSHSIIFTAVSRLHYATFRLIPYYPCLSSVIHITELTDTDHENLDKLAGEDMEEPDKEDQDSYESD